MATKIDPTQSRLAFEVKLGSPAIGCRFDSSGRYLFASAENNTIYRYDLLANKQTSFVGHTSWVRGMAAVGVVPQIESASPAFSLLGGSVGNALLRRTSGAGILLSGDYHGMLRWWDSSAESPACTRSIQAHEGWLRALAVSRDHKIVATCGNDSLVKLWSVADAKPMTVLRGHGCHVYNVAFNPNGKTLVSGDLKGTLKEWDLGTGKLLRDLDAKVFHKYDSGFAADIGGIRGMSFNADGSQLASTGITNVSNAFAGVGNPLVVVFDLKDGKAKQFKPKEAFQGTGWGVDFLPNGWIVGAGGTGQGRVWWWKPDDVTSVHTLNVPTNCRDMSIHPDGSMFAIAGANGSVMAYTMTPQPPEAKKDPVPAKKK